MSQPDKKRKEEKEKNRHHLLRFAAPRLPSLHTWPSRQVEYVQTHEREHQTRNERMSEYDTVLSAASQLPVTDRLRLIDELASSVPDDQPPRFLNRGSRRSSDDRKRSTLGRWRQNHGWMCERGFSESTGSTVRIDYHPEAVHELEASANWYAARNPTAARNFALAVDAAIQEDP